MAGNSQDLVVNLYGKDVSYSDALKKMALVSKMRTIEASTHFDEMGRRIDSASNRASTSITSGFGGRLASWAQSGLAGILGGVAASVTSTVTSVVADAGEAILGQLKSSVIDYNSQLEQSTIGFTTILGNSGKAKQFLDQLQGFATRTPFSFGDLTQYSQQMLAYGIKSKDVIPTLTALGDAASGAGKSSQELGNVILAYSQIAARGKVDLGNLNQLTSGGVPALQILADSYGVTKGEMLKMISAGKVMADDALPRIRRGLEEGTKHSASFGGMMAKQSKTFAGSMSNIKDAMDQTLSSAFRPFYRTVEQGAGALQRFTSSKGFQRWAADTGRMMSGWMRQVGGALREVFSDPKVQKAMRDLGRSLGDMFKQVGPALRQILPNLVRFGKEVIPVIADAVQDAAAKLPTLIAWWTRLSKGLSDATPVIKGVIGFLSDFAGGLFDLSAGIGNFVADAIGNFTRFLRDSKARFNGLLDFVGGLPARFSRLGSDAVQGLINGVTSRANDVISTARNLAEQVAGPFFKALQFGSPSKLFRKFGSWVGQGLHQGLLGTFDQVKSASKSLADAVTKAFAGGSISRAAESSALATIARSTNRLKALAKERESVLSRLSSLRSDRSSLQTSTYESVRSQGDITSFASPGDTIEGLGALVKNTKTFTADLNALSKKGVGSRMLSQLVNGWQSDPGNALRVANDLLANPTDLRQIVALQGQLQHAAGTLGRAAGRDIYAADIAATSGKARVLGWEMQHAARHEVRAVSRDLHVHVNVNGHYAGTKDDLAKTIKQVVHDAIKRGSIPKNWATG